MRAHLLVIMGWEAEHIMGREAEHIMGWEAELIDEVWHMPLTAHPSDSAIKNSNCHCHPSPSVLQLPVRALPAA